MPFWAVGRRGWAAAIAASSLLAGCAETAPDRSADPCAEAAPDAVSVIDAWVREQATLGAVTSAYFVVCNRTAKDATLVGAASDLAAAVEIHETARDATGVVSMRRAPALTVAPGAALRLAPGGRHVMLLGLKRPAPAGGVASITLQFNEQEIGVDAEIRAAADPRSAS